VYKVVDVGRFVDKDSFRLGSTKQEERSIEVAETVRQRGRKPVGESLRWSFDQSSSWLSLGGWGL